MRHIQGSTCQISDEYVSTRHTSIRKRNHTEYGGNKIPYGVWEYRINK